jgi:membrane-associated phospholipid phosphatase
VALGGALTTPGPAPGTGDPDPAEPVRATAHPGATETLVGAVMVAVSVVAAVAIAVHPGPNALDRWGFRVAPHSPHSAVLVKITDLGSPVVLIAGALLAAVVVRHDRMRAASCLVGPLLAALLVEYSFKPLVGRHFEGVLSYPSGSTADVAALATAWALAVPPRARPAVIVSGALVTVAMSVAVTGLRWHYPSDALGGAVLGVGTVVLVDGVLHLWQARHRSRAAAPTPTGRSEDP